MRRTIFMLVFMGTTLALAAGVALAQGAETSRGTIDFLLPAEDCTGEPLRVSGQLNSVIHITERADGFLHVNVHHNFANVTAIGLVTGVEYRLTQTLNSTQNFTSGEYPILISTEVLMRSIIGQGQTPDRQATAVVHFVIHEDGTTTGQVDQVRFECRS